MQPQFGKHETESQLVGLDIGCVRTGAAISDSGLRLAVPLLVLQTEPRQTLGARLLALLAGRQVGGLVVGLPLGLRGMEGQSAALARELGDLLAAELGCPVHYIDERYSTKAAQAAIRPSGAKGQRARKELDAHAATLILQSYLDRLQS